MAERTPEEIALERIEEASREKLAKLDLSRIGLEQLPSQIGKLNLLILDLSGNNLTTLPPEIGNLRKLRDLYLERNQLTRLPPEIGKLSRLQVMNLTLNQIGKLPREIGQLRSLAFLYLGANKLRTLPPEFSRLYMLKELVIGDNNFDRIPRSVCDLPNLIRLFAGENTIWRSRDGKSVYKIPIRMDDDNEATSNHISTLSKATNKLKKLKQLDLSGNPLSIPIEILSRINEPKVILNYYFKHIGKPKRPINQVKLLFIGQGSVGKTSLVDRILHNTFDLNHAKTDGIQINQWKIQDYMKRKVDSQINLSIWDFGGQEIMHATHQFFLTKRSLYLLVIDSRLTQEENRIEYWLKIIQSFGGESPILIVGNKTDQHPLDIDRTGLQKKYPSIVGIIETSAATNTGIKELKAAITKQVLSLPHVHDLLPETWFTVKAKLERLGLVFNFITYDQYLELCTKNEISDETSQRTLIDFLHDLGVVLYFQDDLRLSELGILDPQWVTNGVYKILNSHTLFKNKGVLAISILDEILNQPEYPRGKRLFIVDMMKKFELCYNIEADKTLLIPDLLPKDEPAELNFTGIPVFEYAYPVLPSSVITRFIVRMNQKIDDGLVWRTGVVLKIGDNTALVKADIEDRKITIAIDGLEHTRRDALSAIRYQLDEIHNSIKGLNPEKYVPVPGAVKAKPLGYIYLLKMERAGKETVTVEDGDNLIDINISQVLNGVESEYQREQYGNVTNIHIDGNVTDSVINVGDENYIQN